MSKALLFLILALAIAGWLGLKFALAGGLKLPPEAAIESMRRDAAKAIVIDVREPAEWTEGVAESAVLLPLSDLRGAREKWRPFLEANRDKRMFLYCRSGARSGQAADILKREGFTVANIGGYRDWVAAGLPTRKPE